MPAKPTPRTRKEYSQAKRLLMIYHTLANRPGGATIADLLEVTGVTRRTLNRDLGLLQEDHLIDDHALDAQGRKRWALLPAGPASSISFTRGELMALHLGRSMLAFAVDTELGAAMQSAFAKVAQRIGVPHTEGLARRYYALPDAPPLEVGSERFDDVLNEVLTALERGHCVEIEYPHGQPPSPQRLRLHPLTLAYYRGRLYLVAIAAGHDDPYAYAIHRVTQARWCRGEVATIPEGYDPEQHFSSNFGIFRRGPSADIVLRFRPGAARYVRERQWHRSQVVAERPDGGCDLQLTLPPTPDFESWILSFGEDVTVLQPPSLRERMRQRLLAACAAVAAAEPAADPETGVGSAYAAADANAAGDAAAGGGAPC